MNTDDNLSEFAETSDYLEDLTNKQKEVKQHEHI
jgi:hypothetical protein